MVMQFLKDFWLNVTNQPIDISECTTFRQSRRWFTNNGLDVAMGKKNPEELRELLFEVLTAQSIPFDHSLNSAIRRYLIAEDEKADQVITSSDLEADIWRADTPEAYDAALSRYRARKRK